MKKMIFSLMLIVVMSGCSSKKVGVDPHFVIYPYDFYEKFNLRSIISSYRFQLQNSCLSYPKDFFQEQDMRVANNTLLVLQNRERSLRFEMIAYNKVIITDEVFEGGYKAKLTYTIYHNTDENDFRADEVFITKKESCASKSKDDGNKIIE